MLDEYEPFRWRDFFKGIRTKWVIFAAGLAFFVIGLGSIDGWPAGHTAIVLGIAWTSALMAVSLHELT
jgi:hypothetical protein